MRVALGAWGLGSYLASHSAIWKTRFGANAEFRGTLPPMSAIFGGMVEPFPFVLATKVFIDADQCDFLLSGGDSVAWHLNKQLAVLLREFDNGGVLAPISFRSLLKPKADALVEIAETILDSPELPAAAVDSRRLWSHFLHSPGAKVLPHLDHELRIADKSDDFHRVINVRDHPELAERVPTDRVSLAALSCGHDVFDVVAMLSVSADLDAVLCDWHMYDPLYSLAIRLGHFNHITPGGSNAEETNLRWYIPIPRNLDIDHIWKLREDPYISAVRDADIAKAVSAFGSFDSPEAWRDLRRDVQQKVGEVIFNPYNAHSRTNGEHIVTERLDGHPHAVDSEQSIRAVNRHSMSPTINNEHRILFLAADPTDACRLRLSEEHREISEKLRLSRARDQISLHQAFAVRPPDLTQAILDHVPTIIHFAGHGSTSGAICFENNIGETHEVDSDALANLFRHFDDTLQLVVLNACYSAAQARAIADHIPFVIGMQDSISDAAAIGYSVGLYQAIGAGQPIPKAHELGCSQIQLQGLDEHDVPTLITG